MRVLAAANPAVDRLLETAARLRGRSALTLLFPNEEKTFSYAELIAKAQEWRRRYAECGLAPGERVVVILEHGEACYAAYLGALLAGLVPAYFAHPSEKVSAAAYGATLEALLDRIGGDFVVTSRAIASRLGGKLPGGLLDDGSALESKRQTKVKPSLGDALFLQFSSGTTGLKKGVAVSAKSLLWQVDAYAARIGASERDVIASWLPLYHDMGLIACFFLPLLRGVPLVAMSPFDWVARPERLLAAVTRHRATLVWLPNFAYHLLAARAGSAAGADLSSLRALINCSEPVLESSHRLFLERLAPFGLRAEALASCYALAENTFAVTSGGIDRPLGTETRDGRVLVGSGRALPETRIRVLDASGSTVADGQVGEIAISSPSLFSGYVGSSEKAVDDGWFRTGDQGFLRDGELFVVGRIKDLLILGGRNVYPQDVEAVVDQVPGVIPGRCVALGVDDGAIGTQVLVIVAETRLSDRAARDELRRRVHDAVVAQLDLVPAEVALADHLWLRKSTSGKMARAENRSRYLQAKASSGAGVNPETPPTLEAAVRACIAQALGRSAPPFMDDEDLVQCGIVDSFSWVGLQIALEERFGEERTRRIRAAPDAHRSVRAVAAALEGETAPPPARARQDPKYELAPQMRDVEAQPYEWVAYLMRRGMANYRSPTLNSDEHGFRATWRGGKPLPYAEFMSQDGMKAVVLGNSFAYGIGTTHDANTFASRLNRGGMPWYNLAQRASVCLQERLACELYAPEGLAAIAWVTGVNNLISLIVGEGAPGNPAPFVGERQYAQRMMPAVRFGAHAPFAERYGRMLRQLEIDIAALALRLAGGGRLGFFLQPSATWIDKRFTAEERLLIECFDGAGSVLQDAHHPRQLGPLHLRFAADLKAICARHGAQFVDSNADARFRASEWLFIDRTHMTDAGHAVMAGVVADWLDRR